MNVIIDTDVGWDDVLTISLLVKNPNINLLGITVTGTGEAHLDEGVEISRRILKAANSTARVYKGTRIPNNYDHAFPELFRKNIDTIGNPKANILDSLPKSDIPIGNLNAWEFISEQLSTQENQITIISIGGLTNLENLLKMSPKPKLQTIERIVIMGGAFRVDGNIKNLNNLKPEYDQGSRYSTNKYAEWNIFLDPLAAQTVLHSGLPITLIPLDLCNNVILTQDYANFVTSLDPIAQLVKKVLIEFSIGDSKESILPIFDPLAGLWMSGELRSAVTEYRSVIVELEDKDMDNNCGQTKIIVDDTIPKVQIAISVSREEFERAFMKMVNLPTPDENNLKISKNVGILVWDDCEVQDLAGPFEIFAAARNKDGTNSFNVYTISAEEKEMIYSTAGEPPKGIQSKLNIKPDYNIDNSPNLDVLFIIGGQGIDKHVGLNENGERVETKLIKWIKEQSHKAEYVVAVCSGVLLLAVTGMITPGIRVTTHHTRFEQLRDLSLKLKLNLQVVDTRGGYNYVHEMYSKYMTGGGVYCSNAMALHVIELYMGRNYQNSLASNVLEYPIPRGMLNFLKNERNEMKPEEFILGFSHANIIVRDVDMMEEATEFYRKVLGFRMAWSVWLPDEANKHFATDAGIEKCELFVRFLVHPNAQFHIELMHYRNSIPEGNPNVHYHKTNDVGGFRHIAVEVKDAVKAYRFLKEQKAYYNITILSKEPVTLRPDTQKFFYFIDPYGAQWEFEEGRPMQRVINGIVG